MRLWPAVIFLSVVTIGTGYVYAVHASHTRSLDAVVVTGAATGVVADKIAGASRSASRLTSPPALSIAKSLEASRGERPSPTERK